MQVLKHFYRVLGEDIVGALGFKDAFNQSEGWVAGSYIAIDQGPIICMIENYRSGLLWDNFMANSEIQNMLNAIGFVPDSTTTISSENSNMIEEYALYGNYPNPFNPGTHIRFSIDKPGFVNLSIYNIKGQLVHQIGHRYSNSGYQQIYWNGMDHNKKTLSSGIYFYKLDHGSGTIHGKMLLSK